MLRDLSEHLRQQIAIADALHHRMNAILKNARSSQGVYVQVDWGQSAALDQEAAEALALVTKSLALRSTEQDARLRKALQGRIEAERDTSNAHYPDVLTRALDYRRWHEFTVRVQDTGPDGKPRNRGIRQISSGEIHVVSYVTLLAAAAAFYDDLAGKNALRIVLLDEAFERVDPPTKTRLLELLVDLDMDWIITWTSGSAFSPKITKMHLYDVFRATGLPGMTFDHTTWDGITAVTHQP